jgi:hypothetical protein
MDRIIQIDYDDDEDLDDRRLLREHPRRGVLAMGVAMLASTLFGPKLAADMRRVYYWDAHQGRWVRTRLTSCGKDDIVRLVEPSDGTLAGDAWRICDAVGVDRFGHGVAECLPCESPDGTAVPARSRWHGEPGHHG